MIEAMTEGFLVVLSIVLVGAAAFVFTFFWVLGFNVWFDDQREKLMRKKNEARPHKED